MLTARRSGPLAGEARIGGDKSCSHRALILGAMMPRETVIAGLGEGADIDATVDALRAFGRAVERDEDRRWRVEGGPWRSPERPIDCGNSGTSARLLIGAVAGMAGVEATFVGDGSLNQRPMRWLVEPLRRNALRGPQFVLRRIERVLIGIQPALEQSMQRVSLRLRPLPGGHPPARVSR